MAKTDPNPIPVPIPTCQIAVVNPLFDFGLLDDDGCVLGQEQLPGSCLVSFPVVLDHRHCILKQVLTVLKLHWFHWQLPWA